MDGFGVPGTVKMVGMIKLDPREAPKWLKFRNWQL